MIELDLPFPPSVNGYWRNIAMGKRPRTIISEKGRDYRAATIASILRQHSGYLLRGRLAVEVTLYAPDRRARDIDNYLKGLLDAITHSKEVWEDDGQIDELRIERGEIRKGGGCRVTVTEIAAAAEQTTIAEVDRPF